jgi:hypothetical protein
MPIAIAYNHSQEEYYSVCYSVSWPRRIAWKNVMVYLTAYQSLSERRALGIPSVDNSLEPKPGILVSHGP